MCIPYGTQSARIESHFLHACIAYCAFRARDRHKFKIHEREKYMSLKNSKFIRLDILENFRSQKLKYVLELIEWNQLRQTCNQRVQIDSHNPAMT